MGDQTQAKIAAIRDRFVANLPLAMSMLDGLPDTAAGSEEILRIAHGMHGSAGTLGVEAVADAAATLEAAARAPGARPSALAPLIADLRAAVARAVRDLEARTADVASERA